LITISWVEFDFSDQMVKKRYCGIRHKILREMTRS
jgi:hypothetical protein